MTNNDLINKIKRMKNVEPSESWLVSNREFIFKYIELDDKKEKESVARTGLVFDPSVFKDRIRAVLAMFQNRMLAGAVSMAAVFVLVGGFVAGEAEGSMPGDNLYAVKTFMEKAQLAFAYNDEKRVALNFEFTEKRLDEFSTIAARKDENSSEVKTAVDNLNNQLKVAAQELNNAKNNSSAEKAVSVAKIADTKTTAYAKKLNEVKKDLSEKKQDQLKEVAFNVEELNDSALAVLATNSKVGDLNTEDIAAKLKEKIALAEENIDSTEIKVSLYEAEIKNSKVENKEAVESLALSVKLITEAKAVIAEAQEFFEKGDFSKTWDLLVNAAEIAKVAENVGNRVAVAPSPSPTATPIISPEPVVSSEPLISPVPSISPEPSIMVSPEPIVSPAPQPLSETSTSAEAMADKTAGEAEVSATPDPTVSPAPAL